MRRLITSNKTKPDVASINQQTVLISAAIRLLLRVEIQNKDIWTVTCFYQWCMGDQIKHTKNTIYHCGNLMTQNSINLFFSKILKRLWPNGSQSHIPHFQGRTEHSAKYLESKPYQWLQHSEWIAYLETQQDNSFPYLHD